MYDTSCETANGAEKHGLVAKSANWALLSLEEIWEVTACAFGLVFRNVGRFIGSYGAIPAVWMLHLVTK